MDTHLVQREEDSTNNKQISRGDLDYERGKAVPKNNSHNPEGV